MANVFGSASVSKTARPDASAVFRRERLFREINCGGSALCTWVSGPPGSGKTSLMASFVSARSVPSLWYQVDPDDGDPSTFFSHLSAAARRALGEPAGGLPAFTPDAAFSLPTFARHYFRQLYSLAPELMLVLDDYHQAPLECPLHEVLRIAIEQAAGGVRIAVLSRTRAPVPLARLQVNGVLRSIPSGQLMLSVDEVMGIAAAHGMPLDLVGAEVWRERCGGWAAGLRLLLRPSSPPDLRVAAGDSPRLLFDYLGLEVFRKLAPALQSTLLEAAFLPRMPVDVLRELDPSFAAERHLASMSEDNLFTTVSSEGPMTYRFHPLFRDFLIQCATASLPVDEVAKRRHRAADALLSQGLVEDAAHVLIDAQCWPCLAGLVTGHAPKLMAQGRHQTLGQWLSALPAALVEQEPWLTYWLGASRLHFNPALAQQSFTRAYDAFNARQDLAGVLLAWSGVVDAIFYSYFDLAQVDLWIERLDRMQANGLEFPSPEIEAKVTFSMFVALAFRQPQHAQFDAWRRRLAGIADAAPDAMFRLMARQYLLTSQIWSGDLCGASAALNELKREAARRPATPFVELVGALSEATLALYAGEVTDCFDAIDRALATAQHSGIHIWDKVLLGQGAALAFSHGEIARGQAFAQRRAALARSGDMEERSLYHAIEAWCCWLAGRRAEALAQVRLCTAASLQMGLPHFTAVGSLAMAVVSFDCGDPSGALQQVEVGRSIGLSTRNPMLEWMADLLEAYMRLRLGEPATALVEKCMSLGRQHGYRHFFFWPRSAVAVVCQAALSKGIQVEYVTELIDKGRLVAPAEADVSDHWPRPVKVYVLGSFNVVVRGAPIRFEGKAQRAPLNLLKVIVAFGGHDVAERRIIDALWPDAEGGAGEQALATTLSRLRKLVGANTVKRQAGHLGLDSTQCWVDCWALDKVMRRNQNIDPQTLCDHIERLYRGRFLDGEEEAQWMLHLREHIHVGLVTALCQSAEAALRNRQPGAAARFYELGLGVDDLVEEFYAGLIRCQIESGQPSLVVATYHRCHRTLSKRLGVTPSDKTTRLYLGAIEGKTTWRS